jgi:hypothetical protein
VVVDIAKINPDHLGAQSAAGRNGADMHLAHCQSPLVPKSSAIQPDVGQILADVLTGVMFQPLTLAVVGTIRFYQRIGAV